VSKKKVLIIVDETETIQPIAQTIKDTLADYEVKLCSAEKFEGTALLSAEVFFLGCENPNPSSFSYIEEMLAHINLALKKCGIFSTDKEALKYLAGIVKDSEAKMNECLCSPTGETEIKDWLKKFIE
jgi:hypothetical protein